MSGQKVAIIHDWLTVWAGAEKVLEQMLELWPEADVFCLINHLPENQEREFLKGRVKKTSFLQDIPFSKKIYRFCLPLMPFAIEQFDLTGYDLVISSSHAVAKGVITGPDSFHLCYCHSPMRYAWDFQHEYLGSPSTILKKICQFPVRYLLHRLRQWDFQSGQRPDLMLANSKYISRRIRKCYRRESLVVYPPVNTDRLKAYFKPYACKKDYYIVISRLVPYKRVQLIAEAFSSMAGKKLVIIGDGPERANLEQYIESLPDQQRSRITYLGYQDDAKLFDYLSFAKAMVFAAEEDFGILPVESQSVGTPVIAYGRGGATETVEEGKTGLFFHEPTVSAIQGAVNDFEQNTWDSDVCADNANKFAKQVFQREMQKCVEDWNNKSSRATLVQSS